MISALLVGWLGWYFVPHFVTKQLLSFKHRFRSSPPGSALDPRQEYKIVYTVVVIGYLLYNLVQGARGIEGNFYQTLNVSKDVDDTGIKQAFRMFAKRYHPDKVGIQGEAFFMYVRDVVEALKDPMRRKAYDRFGPEVLSWPPLSSDKEYLYRGLMQSSGYHIVSGLVLFVISNVSLPFLGANKQRAPVGTVVYWRYILYFALLAMELEFILYPVSPLSPLIPSPSSLSTRSTRMSSFLEFFHTLLTHGILATFFPNRIPYQHVRFLHHMFVFLSAALGQVGPLFASFVPGETAEEETGEWEKAEMLAGLADREASVLLHTELASIHYDDTSSDSPLSRQPKMEVKEVNHDTMGRLMAEMENMVIERNVMQDVGPMRAVWETAVRRRSHSELQQVNDSKQQQHRTGIRGRSLSCFY